MPLTARRAGEAERLAFAASPRAAPDLAAPAPERARQWRLLERLAADASKRATRPGNAGRWRDYADSVGAAALEAEAVE